jgi:hypothetical protein
VTPGAINQPCHQHIDETLIADDGWATRHGAAIGDARRDAPFTPAIEPLLVVVTDCRWERLAPLLGAERRPLRASGLGIGDSGTARRRAIRRAPGATRYVTGHMVASRPSAVLPGSTATPAASRASWRRQPRTPGPEAPAHAKRRMLPWRDVVARQAYASDGAR